jgi:DNA-binding beta-propeller fold protein YncE
MRKVASFVSFGIAVAACCALIAGAGPALAVAPAPISPPNAYSLQHPHVTTHGLGAHGVWLPRFHRFSTPRSALDSPIVAAPLTVPAGSGPQEGAVDQADHTLYVANSADNTVSAINTLTCNALITTACSKTSPTIAAGNFPEALALDPATNTVYVDNINDNTVSVINGATCNAELTTGCGQSAPAVTVGFEPVELRLDPAHHTLYVANFGDGTVSMINTLTCNAKNTAGCSSVPGTISFGAVQPAGLFVDATTSTLFVANLALTASDPVEADTISLVNAATCNAQTAISCGVTHPTTDAGLSNSDENVSIAEDQATRTLYIDNYSANTISIVALTHCSVANTSGCGTTWPTITEPGGLPVYVTVDPLTRTLYDDANGNGTVSAFSITACNAQATSGCGASPGEIRGGVNSSNLVFDPLAATIYIDNDPPYGQPGDLSVVSTLTCNAVTHVGCTTFPATAAVGDVPTTIALDPLTHTAYVTNVDDNTLSVINTAACSALTTASCPSTSPTVAAPGSPYAVAVDPGTDTVYVAEAGSSTVSVFNGATCNALTTTGCGQTPKAIPVGNTPISVIFDAADHTLYVANSQDATLSVINTQLCNATQSAGCAATPPTLAVGNFPGRFALNPATHTLYLANNGDNTISVINTQACNGGHTAGCSATPPTLGGISEPDFLAFDPSTNTLYAPVYLGRSVAVYNAATCNAITVSGCGQTPGSITVGSTPNAVAVDPIGHRLYVGDFLDNAVSVVNTTVCNAVKLAPSCAQEASSIAVGQSPLAEVVDQTNHTLYVTNGLEDGLDNDVSLVPLQ